MGSETPKQYLELHGRPVIDHTLQRLIAHPQIARIYVALSPNDGWWDNTASARHPKTVRTNGGAERCYSVLNALNLLQQTAEEDDWVLVHDAVRPCLQRDDLDRLLDQLKNHPVGGLLGVPVRDTMKRTDGKGAVQETVSRDGLWHAFTPQMFRLGLLHRALEEVLAKGALVTDDASAMELAGHVPKMVEGRSDNIKITRPGDLELAAFYLSRGGA
jgi:2-C-methyl-D-erythritol 4-phosphate cytidylyltransferase